MRNAERRKERPAIALFILHSAFIILHFPTFLFDKTGKVAKIRLS
jgi:hypothetical protein